MSIIEKMNDFTTFVTMKLGSLVVMLNPNIEALIISNYRFMDFVFVLCFEFLVQLHKIRQIRSSQGWIQGSLKK